jgi:nucleotidyltransferase substrate binding protein (TIGR01987 family)
MSNENRWIQRLQNLNKAFKRLEDACDQEEYNELEVAGLVQTYEFTFELCWKTLKDKLMFEGYAVNSPRETINKAFEMELLTDVDEWLEALESRNLFSHTYEHDIAQQAIALIKDKLEPMLSVCVAKLNELAKGA